MSKPKGQQDPERRSSKPAERPLRHSGVETRTSGNVYFGVMKILNPPEPIRRRKRVRSK